ncbi:hypothetical protein G6O69_28535 [Pseudenhygromyxa sp. WMMC2535]|uniref:Tc toxin subunit A-related protein n=1 Tax=Pseudenhygromyxa sp. WMMC2535 TaxID=2712867 RepID=UPI001555F3A6|nr:neuraminidase-like domain-containing protein [Pseudenhygromyxa sp. WMMC2535]NVB41814.1 hypothetical protein [Pseudenhygromyxa sp. WMMC2535]
MATFTFQGTVVDTAGEPQSGRLVTIYRKTTLRDNDARQPTATTDTRGSYTVGFTWSDVESGDFEVVVTDVSTSEELGRSVVLFELGEGEHRVDIVTGGQSYRGRSEFRRVDVAVEPLAWEGASKIDYADLALDDIEYLASKAGFPASVIALFIHAHRLADLSERAVGAQAFYGMLREGLSPTLAELLAQGPEVQRAALERAVTRNLIDEIADTTLAAYITALDSLAIDVAVWTDQLTGESSKFRKMIDSAGRESAEGAESVQRAFLAKYAAHDGDLDSFWSAVIADPELGQDVHDTYKWSLQVQAVCNGHQELIDVLQAKRNDAQDPILEFGDLATIDVEGWKTLINAGVGVPTSIPESWDESDRVQRYAETIARLVSDTVPTRVVHERIKRDAAELGGATDLDTFFTQNPDFDLRDAVVQRYLDANPTAFDEVPTSDDRRAACLENVKTIQRLSYMAPRGSTYDTLKPLYVAGIRSAADVDAMGPVAFVRRFAANFGEGELGKIRARAVYDRASHVYGMTLALLSKHAPSFNAVNIGPVLQTRELPSSAPDLEALFGSMDYCGCEHCRSVFSPAAYMVDLLQFLRQQPGTGSDALTDLQARRPDLTKIDLSCANGSTALPYIDLVNELLETRVSQGEAPAASHWQTTWTAEELALRPEHRDEGAYTELVAAAYPWNLPFDLDRTEADLYLDELGVSRHALLETFDVSADADALSRARLGLSAAMAAAITGGEGFSTLDSWNGESAATLTSVEAVLETSGQDFDALEVLLETSFVGEGLSMSFAAFPDECDLSQASVDGLSDAHLERWHRFVRLQGALGWTAYQLDAALRAFAPTPGSLDAAFLQRLGAVAAIGERLELDGLALFELWAGIDLRTPPEDSEAPSRYASAFLRRTLIADPEGSNFALDGDELSATALAMSDDARMSVVAAALGVSSAEIGQLVSWLSTAGMPADTTTNLAILSAARRRVTLARALGVTLTELRRLIALTGIDPFHDDAASVVDMAGLQRTADFLDAAQLVLDSPFSAQALGWILLHEAPTTAGIEPDSDATIALLTLLDEQLAGVSEGYALVADPSGARLRDALAEYLAPSEPADLAADAVRLDALMAIIAGTSSEDEATQTSTIAAELGGFLVDLAASQAALVGAGELDDRSARYQHVLDQLLPWLEARARRAVTIQTLSDGLGLAVDLGEQLLVTVMRGAEEAALVESFESGGNVDAQGEPTSSVAEAFTRLYKAGALVMAHGFDADDLTYLYGEGAPEPSPWLHVDDLGASQATQTDFAAWSRMAAVARARARFTEIGDTLEQLRAIALVDEVDALLAEWGGWRTDDVSALRQLYGLSAPEDFDDEAAFMTLLDALELVTRVGVSASMIVSLAAGEASAGEADALRLSLRASHGDASWASTGKALRDHLRERQRDALVGYLLARGDEGVSFANENALYAHYLLDVEMSACASTSRIKLALSSIQLFIQRVFLNLEAGIEFDADAAVQYRWMKNYRVWEANRKVFLYPENFVEPELRSDKSPLYAELEAVLAQDEPSEKLTERAFLGYLGGLESIAKPEVMGLVRERDGQTELDRLHVLARTRGEPHRWLYRTREDGRVWTAWVELPVEIEGDHALPVVFNGRLYVMWPTFRLTMDEIESVSEDDQTAGSRGKGVMEISLNWMERRFDEWSAPRNSGSFRVADRAFSEFQADDYVANARLATRNVINTATGQPTLEVCVRSYKAPSETEFGILEGNIYASTVVYAVIGRFLLDASRGEVVAQALTEIEEPETLEKWSYEYNSHRNAAQALRSASDSPDKLRLETTETKWPWRTQSTTLMSAPPTGYRLVFAQDDRAALVGDTGFFYQDRWRSFYLEPRDIYLAGNWTLGMVDPGDIEGAPFMELGGFKTETPSLSLASKDTDPKYSLLAADSLEVQSKWSAGSGLFSPDHVANGLWVSTQLEAVTVVEDNFAAGVYNTLATKEATGSSLPWQGKYFSAVMFEHPHTARFMGQVRAHGVAGLLSPTEDQDPSGTLGRQLLSDEVFSETYYDPNKIDTPWPLANVDFSPGGAYSLYNWEIFFHAPLLLAKRLSASQRFEEADTWLRRIFDPTASSGDVPARYWQIKPFFESAQPSDIHELLLLLHYEGSDQEILAAREAFEYQIWRWRRNPFDPHLIAGLRDGAYQRAVVMAYLDNLIAWGDSLFARDSIESINEATQLYIMAQNILGQRPVQVDPQGGPTVQNFEELESGSLDAFSNAVVELENYTLGSLAHSSSMQTDTDGGSDSLTSMARLPHTWYFCIPPNAELLGYWDTVDDRLDKIRRCQNLQGIERTLALFEPAIDPMALVSAAALAGDFSSALSSSSGRAPTHRFRVLLGKALELAGEVRGLGSNLLQNLEKKDAAALAQLRAGQEPALLGRVRAVRELQLTHAELLIDGLERAMATHQARLDHYQGLIDSGELVEEASQRFASGAALTSTKAALSHLELAKKLSLIPDLQIGIQGFASSPQLTTSIGGTLFSRMESESAGILHAQSSIASMEAGMSATSASYIRRAEDWSLQITLASHELDQLEAQKVAAQTQVEVAKAELDAHDQRIADAEAVDVFMRGRYTNDQLYDWMVKQIKQVYKQAYNLAFRMALGAEQAYRFELQRDDSFIGYQYWDQAHAGLLAGDLLVQDLRRMDAAYIDNYEREYELTKVVSLAKVDPYALAVLRETGSCYFTVPEWIYDLDHPGQIRRRIKSVSVAMPAVAGPHVGGGCTLTLESSRMRVETGGAYAEVENDSRFVYRYGQVERIATSSGRDSTGLFEPSLEGPRYLPFEGAGAISTWHVELPGEFRQFDYESIGDVLLTIRYTAREGGSAQAQAAQGSLATVSAAQTYLGQQSGGAGAAMMLRASVDFADAWYAFLREEHGEATRSFTMSLDASRFPYAFAKRTNLEIAGLRLVLATDAPAAMPASLTVPSAGQASLGGFASSAELDGHMLASWDGAEAPGSFTLSIDEAEVANAGLGVSYGDAHTRFDADKVRELVVVVFFRDQA